MAKGVLHQGDRPPGWPPEHADQSRFLHFPSDDLVLAILWILVVAGLIALGALAVSGISGFLGRSVAVAYAATADSDASMMAPADGTVQASTLSLSPSAADVDQAAPHLVSFAPEIDDSEMARVTLGTLLESTMRSDVLGMDLPYRIYLPPGYYSDSRRYPVVYLLHGNGLGGYREWSDGEQVGIIADSLYREGRVEPMIIVMPEGLHSYFQNHANGGPRWGDYIAREFVHYIDLRYRTIADRYNRAVGGLSMGGTGALQLAFNHQDVFSIVAAHSPSLWLFYEGAPSFFGDWNQDYALYDPVRLALSKSDLDSLDIWMDIGDDDPWMPGALQLHHNLQDRGIPHQWRVFPGTHWSDYWLVHLPDYLGFYSTAFSRSAE